MVMQTSVGKVPQYPNPVASSISSRVMVELGAVTAAIAAAAVVVSGFLASAAFAVGSFVYVGTVYAIWPIAKSFLTVPLEVLVGVLERMGDVILDMFIYGGISAKFNELYTFGVFSSAFKIARPMLLVGVCMVILLRFTLSRRPKNFRKWVRYDLSSIISIIILLYLALGFRFLFVHFAGYMARD